MRKIQRHRWVERVRLGLLTRTLLLGAAPPALAEDIDLDTAISQGFGKLIKYGRWTAALILAIVFCLSWAERGQNQDNPHEVTRSTKKMIWTGVGFVAVIGYKLILTGLVKWFGADPNAIPSFIWQ